MTKLYLHAIDQTELQGVMLWVIYMGDTVEESFMEDITEQAAQNIGVSKGTYLKEASSSPTFANGYWLNRKFEENQKQNYRILKTRHPETDTWWTKSPKGRIGKYLVTKTAIDECRVLITAHNCTQHDQRIEWLENCNWGKQKVYLGNDNTLTFKNMEALDLMTRGFNDKEGAAQLHIGKAAYRKRLDKCMEAFEAESMTELRLKVSGTGFIHLLMLDPVPPYGKLELADKPCTTGQNSPSLTNAGNAGL